MRRAPKLLRRAPVAALNYPRQDTNQNTGNAYFTRNQMHIGAMLFGCATAYHFLDEKYRFSPMICAAANTRVTFDLMRSLIESHLATAELSVFSENRDPKTEKRRLLFMGESAEQAQETLRNGKSPIQTDDYGNLVMPIIIDATLHADATDLPGTCKGLTGLTADSRSTKKYEAVHLVIPSKSKMLITSLHATSEAHNDAHQFATAGLYREEIFATLYRDPKTKAFSHITLNENFKGDLSELELDPLQMPEIIDLIPDAETQKTLRECINPNLHPKALYESKLAPCAKSHQAAVQARRLFKQPDTTLESFQGRETADEVNVIHTADGRVFSRFGDQSGGNPGGFFMGHDNEAYYIKYGLSNGQVLTDDEVDDGMTDTTTDSRRMNSTRFENEFLIGQLYRAFGITVPKTHLIRFKKNGQEFVGIASKFEPDLVRYNTYSTENGTHPGWENDHTFIAKLQHGGLIDLLLGNYDVIGLGFDNTLGKRHKITKELNPIRIDPGAGLLFRAKGTPLDLTPDADDFLTETSEPGNWFEEYAGTFGECFNNLTKDYYVLNQAIRTLESVSPDELNKIFKEHGYQNPNLTEQMLETVLQRREAILERAHQLQHQLYATYMGNELSLTNSKRFQHPSSYITTPSPTATPSSPAATREKTPSMLERANSMSASFVSSFRQSVRRGSRHVPAQTGLGDSTSISPEELKEAKATATSLSHQSQELHRQATMRNLSLSLSRSSKNSSPGDPPDLTSPTYGEAVVSEDGSPIGLKNKGPSPDPLDLVSPMSTREAAASKHDGDMPTDPKNTDRWEELGFRDGHHAFGSDTESDSEDNSLSPTIPLVPPSYNSIRLFTPEIEKAIKQACEAINDNQPEPLIKERIWWKL